MEDELKATIPENELEQVFLSIFVAFDSSTQIPLQEPIKVLLSISMDSEDLSSIP